MKKIDYFIKKYLENRPFFYAFIRPQEAILFQKNLHLIKKPVLDFGCGDGFFAKLVIEDTVDIGLDLYMSRSNEAKKQKIYKRIVNYDGKKIPFPDNCFSTVISNCVLEHIPNLNESLKEIYRILKPGGYFITTVMTDRWENFIFGKKLMRKIQKHYYLLSSFKWQKTFVTTGFKVKKNIGYLSQSSARFNELFHLLSLPYLISYKLFGKWVLFPNIFEFPIISNLIQKNIYFPVKTSKSAACFFVLKKLI